MDNNRRKETDKEVEEKETGRRPRWARLPFILVFGLWNAPGGFSIEGREKEARRSA
jgi:hypothetical protein